MIHPAALYILVFLQALSWGLVINIIEQIVLGTRYP